MTRETAEQFYALTGQTVDQRMKGIASTARKLIEADRCHFKPAEINRWAVRHLDLCARTFCRPPPAELVTLIERQLGVDGPPRNKRRNPEKFIAAAEYKASNPDATPAMIARGIDYDQKRVIAGWLKDPEFQESVALERIAMSLQ